MVGDKHTGTFMSLHSTSRTHLSHIRKWSCVPLCCCWHTCNDPCGTVVPTTPWQAWLRPLLSLPPACGPSPSATSAWKVYQMWWHCHGNAAPSSPSWEQLHEDHWGWWLVSSTLEQRSFTIIGGTGITAPNCWKISRFSSSNPLRFAGFCVIPDPTLFRSHFTILPMFLRSFVLIGHSAVESCRALFGKISACPELCRWASNALGPGNVTQLRLPSLRNSWRKSSFSQVVYCVRLSTPPALCHTVCTFVGRPDLLVYCSSNNFSPQLKQTHKQKNVSLRCDLWSSNVLCCVLVVVTPYGVLVVICDFLLFNS